MNTHHKLQHYIDVALNPLYWVWPTCFALYTWWQKDYPLTALILALVVQISTLHCIGICLDLCWMIMQFRKERMQK